MKLEVEKIGPEDHERWLPFKTRFEAYHVRSKPHALVVLGRAKFDEVFKLRALPKVSVKKEKADEDSIRRNWRS